MIETEYQRQVALKQVKLWKATLDTGQSWLAGEQTREDIMALSTEINEYLRRTASVSP